MFAQAGLSRSALPSVGRLTGAVLRGLDRSTVAQEVARAVDLVLVEERRTVAGELPADVRELREPGARGERDVAVLQEVRPQHAAGDGAQHEDPGERRGDVARSDQDRPARHPGQEHRRRGDRQRLAHDPGDRAEDRERRDRHERGTDVEREAAVSPPQRPAERDHGAGEDRVDQQVVEQGRRAAAAGSCGSPRRARSPRAGSRAAARVRFP